MFKSFKIGTLFRIPVFLHWSFLLLPLLVIYRSSENDISEILWEIMLVGSLFFCVLLHEYGHALSARRYGVETLDIILSIIGGVARLTRIPEKPLQEFIVAVAGPAVNMVIAAFIYLILWVFGYSLLPATDGINAATFLQYLAFANIMLVIFNLVPAFPMDGGRMLRAALSSKLNRVKATFIAMLIGQTLAVIAAGFALYNGHYTLLFIAVFIFTNARMEYRSVKNEAFVNNHTVKEVMKQQFAVVQQSSEVEYAVQLLTNSDQRHFPVLNMMECVGILTHQQILKAIADKHTTAPASAYMSRNITVLSPDDYLQTAVQLFTEGNYELIPVIQDNMMVGIIDRNSVEAFFQTQGA
jgi:Zn-dependent protease